MAPPRRPRALRAGRARGPHAASAPPPGGPARDHRQRACVRAQGRRGAPRDGPGERLSREHEAISASGRAQGFLCCASARRVAISVSRAPAPRWRTALWTWRAWAPCARRPSSSVTLAAPTATLSRGPLAPSPSQAPGPSAVRGRGLYRPSAAAPRAGQGRGLGRGRGRVAAAPAHSARGGARRALFRALFRALCAVSPAVPKDAAPRQRPRSTWQCGRRRSTWSAAAARALLPRGRPGRHGGGSGGAIAPGTAADAGQGCSGSCWV